MNARLIVALLEREGYEVSIAVDGEQAVAISRIEDFDVVLMDVNMPVMNGLEATLEIRNGAAPMRDIPIIALTADEDGTTHRQCVEAGMNAFVSKPVDIRELCKVIDQSLGRKTRRKTG